MGNVEGTGKVWESSGFPARPAGWLPVKSLHSLSWKEEPLKEMEGSEPGPQDEEKGKWGVMLLGGNFPVGTASRASTLKLNGKSLPGLCWSPGGSPHSPVSPQAHPSPLTEAQGLCSLPPSCLIKPAVFLPLLCFPGSLFLALPGGK